MGRRKLINKKKGHVTNWGQDICNSYHGQRADFHDVKMFPQINKEKMKEPIEKWAKDVNGSEKRITDACGTHAEILRLRIREAQEDNICFCFLLQPRGRSVIRRLAACRDRHAGTQPLGWQLGMSSTEGNLVIPSKPKVHPPPDQLRKAVPLIGARREWQHF